MEKRYLIRAPKLAATCWRCNRKLDGRAVGNPFGQWSIPHLWAHPFGGFPTREAQVNFNNKRGWPLTPDPPHTYCGYCIEILARKWDALTQLDPKCEAAQQLTQWLAQPAIK